VCGINDPGHIYDEYLVLFTKSGMIDIPKMAFSTRYNLHVYLVMSFGFTNAPVYLMYLMNYVFMLELDKIVMVFIDGILVYYKNEKKHNIIFGLIYNDFVSTNVT
jgi:hypothetical protein